MDGRWMRGAVTRAIAPSSILVLVLAAAACSSSSPPAGGQTGSTSASPVAASTTAETPSATDTVSSGLSGTWEGTYDGTHQGTFTLDWQQSGSKLTGTIDLSSVGKLPIDGNVNGDTISFGTVGSTAIQYSGSVSGDSMSGSYKVAGGGGSGSGSWSARRTS